VEFFDQGNGIGYSLTDNRPLGRVGIKIIEAKDVPAIDPSEVLHVLLQCI
jgi:hypothetical protein